TYAERLPPPPTHFPYTTLFRSGSHHLGRAAAVADAPAGHGVALGATIDGDGARIQLRHHLRQAHEGLAAPVDLLVDVVGAHQHRSEEHTSELQSRENLVCRLLL